MKIAAVTLAYNDESIIAGTLRCLKDFVDEHFVILSEKPYFGNSVPLDNTRAIAESLGAHVVSGVWPLDHYQRNLGNIIAKDYDWVLTFDSDEMMTKIELTKLVSFLETAKGDCYSIKPEVYWKTLDFRLRPIPEYEPIIAMRPYVRFPHIRNVNVPVTHYDGELHHVSWGAPKDVFKKVTNYAHASDFNGESWYKDNYLLWKEGDPVVLPTDTYSAIYYPLPDELKEYLDA